jgi:FkbM family methyltransferase
VTGAPSAGELEGALHPTASLFTSAPVPAGAVAEGELPTTVRTASEQWAYALTMARAPESRPTDGPAVIRVRLQVTAGSIGVGCLNEDASAFLDEVLVAARPAPDPVDVDLLLMSARTAGALVLRNASPSGPSEATLLDVSCMRLELDGDAPRVPGLSDPRPVTGWSRYYGTPGQTVLEKYRVRLFEGLTEPTVVRWVDGLAVHILPGDQLSRALFVSGTYEPNTQVVLRRLLTDGDVFFDVGANAGVLTLAASRWVGPGGRVYGFEPSAREFERLEENLLMNAARNVTAVRQAVSSSTGRASLRVAAAGFGGLNTLGERFPYEGVDTSRIESVETTTLDDFVEREALDRVDVIKLDVEGAEAAVLSGASRVLRDYRPALVIEVVARSLAANGSTVSQLEDALEASNYALFAIDESACLRGIGGLADVDEQNVVALPRERDARAAVASHG